MRVLQLIKTSFGAGWALRHVKELVKYGVEVHVALPVDGPLVKKYEEVGAYVHELNYSLKNILGTIKGLRKIVAQVQPDIIHSHFVLTTLIMR
ncbi:MAG: glycosyltransferase, partial [Bacteroidales bacterium]|nr:glycosyltransferase [Bacteroidales bacterium]